MVSVLLLYWLPKLFLAFIAKYKHLYQVCYRKTSTNMYKVMLHWKDYDNVPTNETGKPGVAAKEINDFMTSNVRLYFLQLFFTALS